MLSRIDLRGQTAARLSASTLAGLLPRAQLDVEAALDAVRPVCADVRQRGAVAVREQTARFDGVDLVTTRVPAAALDDALEQLDPQLRAALEEAARRARLVHEAQLPSETVTTVAPGTEVTERYVPVTRAGVYVPGGLVAYPSSVVMNVIPAQVAGVGQLAVASPPGTGRGGLPHPAVLAACALLGITEVHAVGGAQAIAMFAYGTARRRTSSAARAMSTSRPPSACCGARSGRTPRPGRPKSPSWPTRAPGPTSSPLIWSRRPSTTRSRPAC